MCSRRLRLLSISRSALETISNHANVPLSKNSQFLYRTEKRACMFGLFDEFCSLKEEEKKGKRRNKSFVIGIVSTWRDDGIETQESNGTKNVCVSGRVPRSLYQQYCISCTSVSRRSVGEFERSVRNDFCSIDKQHRSNEGTYYECARNFRNVSFLRMRVATTD